MATILEAPTLSAADKSAIVAELEKTSGTNETVKNFLQTLAENNRLSLLGGVCTKFNELMSAARGEVEMTVTSATVCFDALQRSEIVWARAPSEPGTDDVYRVVLADAIRLKQPLDAKTLNRLEAAVSKSAYVGQGKRLKSTNEVTTKDQVLWM